MSFESNYYETQYKKLLKKFSREMKNNSTTYASELHKMGSGISPRFRGIYPSDRVPTLKDGDSLIFNVDTHEEPGSHWVSLAKQGPHLYFYDSFGRSPKELVPKANGVNEFLYDKTDSEQKIHETDCGQRCLAWLALGHTYGFNTILDDI